MTIRQWVATRPSSPFHNNTLTRYGVPFTSAELPVLVRNDPSFDVQAQFFAAASYGLMQLIPTDYWERLTRNVPAGQRAPLLTEYDPWNQGPDTLFDPGVCVRLGALTNLLVDADAEKADHSCSAQPTQCSSEHLWRRRMCLFNSGDQGGDGGVCEYSNLIFSNVPSFEPLP